MYQDRHERLRSDRRALEEVAAASSIISFEAQGEAPERYTLIFHGKGPCSDVQGHVSVADDHRCLLRLPFGYPKTAPDIQWVTNLFHPNVGYGGFMQLDDVGLEWHADMSLEVVCERLWDVARLAYINDGAVVNSSAVGYWAKAGWHLPLDDRPLRDRIARQVKNIVRYRRRAESIGADEVLLGESRSSLAPLPRADDVLYIGDEEAE